MGHANLSIDTQLYTMVEQEILPGLNLTSDQVWESLATLLNEFQVRNQNLLNKREQLQTSLNQWHLDHPTSEPAAYKSMLQDIGYLLPEPEQVSVTTSNVDIEISTVAGPQLVVPINNARYALNAANARWGSLYDALYGTDALTSETAAKGYDSKRGSQVIAFAKQLLDTHLPLHEASHSQVTQYMVNNGQLQCQLDHGQVALLAEPTQFAGFQGDAKAPKTLLLKHNNLHLELHIDREHIIGASDLAGLKDIVMEAAVSTIMDCEDSVTAVDAEDKVIVYRNWLGLMKGDLSIDMQKNGVSITRQLNSDRHYQSADGSSFSLHGRSLLFIRNVGHLMTNNAILNSQGDEIPEGIMDGFITSLCALHDIRGPSAKGNSRTGSIYIVKPKMHGPEEVTFTCDLFGRIEDLLDLPKNTLKVGIMDEERRTSVNLKACIAQASERVAFINTGFLDRTGDEIHTSMQAGVMLPKGIMKQQAWIAAYEDNNVETGLACGLKGRAQIGKGMWAKPDCMAEMMATKLEHPMSGASTAWVPSPTAAVLHALHYHQVLVQERQSELLNLATSTQVKQDDLLEIPLLGSHSLSKNDIARELDNNCQGLLGYVIRWVESGIGCSKVADINQVGLMEDRATLRISSQSLANWLEHDFVTKDMVMDSLKRMAALVDEQNAGDPDYRNMAPEFNSSVGFQAACELVFEGTSQPSGYTEPVLHRRRQEAKRVYA
ncbi:MAG: malate synthase G [Oceanospirillaceae bacterium]|jgi:malate synthase|tara:strand:+ start:173 stop:2329 length:2157 start_codon:yes stop_codon:yes gene_type:complete